MVRLIEYALIADKVYEPSSAQEPSLRGWDCPNGFAVDDKSVFSGGAFFTSGLQMRAFRKGKGGDVVIAFKGTRPTMASDVLADLRLALEGLPRQAVDAMKYTSEWKTSFKGFRTTLVGHSLGGAIAQIVGIMTDLRFVTFNAPGMWTNAIGVCSFPKLLNTTQRGMNFIKWGDPIGNFGKHIGDTTRVRSMGHGMVGFVDFVKGYAGRDKDPLD